MKTWRFFKNFIICWEFLDLMKNVSKCRSYLKGLLYQNMSLSKPKSKNHHLPLLQVIASFLPEYHNDKMLMFFSWYTLIYDICNKISQSLICSLWVLVKDQIICMKKNFILTKHKKKLFKKMGFNRIIFWNCEFEIVYVYEKME